jgi:hypothetical protein
MMALILAVGLMQGTANAELGVAATVVRPACVVLSAAGAASWVRSAPRHSDRAHCTLSSSSTLVAPSIVVSTELVEGRSARVIEVNY